ncbi:Metalloenzyme, LuxS/M16 peptidase-like protein [Zopfochytrium polystomum]|nr:Metalloenzyme, LuxS/M16 peptidase-like protein [Zopfochytrium polystomum]
MTLPQRNGVDALERDGIKTFTNIMKPELDDRTYLHLHLPSNNLQALLISDPTTDKAAAALDVHVGHLSDPDSVPGLAHFCEHLLFMGTEKFPEENEYSRFLAEHGGSSNAFTSADHTNYYFDVKAESLKGAFDRFIQFFVTPLFSPSCTERELLAVDSEHKKNLQSDGWRIHQLQKDLSEETHPYRKFGTGNAETLKGAESSPGGRNVRDEVVAWYREHYSANIMRLVVLGKEPIDQMADWVIAQSKLIPSSGRPVPAFPGHPLSGRALQTEIRIKPVKEIRELQINFAFPDLTELYLCKPSSYVSHLVGHESEGSILALLRKLGWARELSAGERLGAKGFGFFTISITLTEEGSKHSEEIIQLVFQYIDTMKKAGPLEWIYEESKNLAEAFFRYSEKTSPAGFVSRVAGQLHAYPPAHALSGPRVMFEMDKQSIADVMERLNPANMSITFINSDFDTTGWSKAAWYGTEYVVQPLSDTLRQALSDIKPNPQLHLPARNEFIPSDLSIRKTIGEKETRPTIIMDTPTIRLWHKKDDTFWVPKSQALISFKTPLAYASSKCAVLAQLYVRLLEDALNEYSYFAHVAGLSMSVRTNTEGVELNVGGFNQKLHVLAAKIVEAMKNLKVDADRFKAIKEEIGRSFKNFSLEQPYSQAAYYVNYVTQEKLWTPEEKLQVLEGLTASDVQAYIPSLLSQLHIEALIHGNTEAEEAIDLMKMIEGILPITPLPALARDMAVRTQLIPTGTRVTYTRAVANASEPNSSIDYYLQLCDATDDLSRVLSVLFAQIAREPAFDTLRTKEQLGYIVFSSAKRQTGVEAFHIIVQSERDPVYLEQRVEAFLAGMKTFLTDLTDEEFAKHVDAVVFKQLEKDKNLNQETSRHWGHIASHVYDFDLNARTAALVKTITKPALLEFYETHIAPSSPRLRKLSVHLRGAAAATAAAPAGAESRGAAAAEGEVLLQSEDDVIKFKHGLLLGRAPVPARSVVELSVREAAARGGAKI